MNEKSRTNYIISVLIIGVLTVLGAVSFVTNLGTLRIILTACLIVPIHLGMMIFGNVFAVKYLENKSIKIINLVFNVLYVLTCLALPDFAENANGGTSYMFFGQIALNRVSSSIMLITSIVLTAVYITTFVLEIITINKLKKANGA